MRRILTTWAAGLVGLGLSQGLQAQWIQQQIELRPGWNAVFLEVHPVPEDCDALFANQPVESVWDFNPTVDSPQFVQDPSTLIPGTPGWLTWFPPGSPLASQGNLFILRDGRPYLIKLADSAAPVTWTVVGRPSLRGIRWRPGEVNFVGFRVGTTASSFEALFAGESGLAGQPVYELDPSGVWRPLLDPATAKPKTGEAYWVRCGAPAERTATLEVDAGSREGLVLEAGFSEATLRVRNTSNRARQISVRLLESAQPPDGQPALAGPVPLEYWKSDYANTNLGWEPFPAVLSFSSLPASAEWRIRLGVRRSSGAESAVGAQYQSLIEVADDAGTRWRVPVRATPARVTTDSGLIPFGSDSSAIDYAGLWIGDAVIDAVSQPAHPTDPTAPRPAGGPFPFRLIVHVDGTGTARLLQRVYLVRKPPTYVPDPENPGFNVLDEPARTVVLTDESLIPAIIGTGEIVGRRISSAAFGFSEPLRLNGGPFGAGTLNGLVELDYDHPLNPFKHVYHPDHNSVDDQVPPNPLAEGKESFTVIRSLALEFTGQDPVGLDPPGWGDTELGGVYRETITGLHRSAIRIEGHFRLVQVAPVPDLNDGQAISLSPDFVATFP